MSIVDRSFSAAIARCGICFAVILSLVLMFHSGCVHSPGIDEPAHLAAGSAVLAYGNTNVYQVNPPLVKSIAAVPLVLSGAKVCQPADVRIPGLRDEWMLGDSLISANGSRSFWLMTIGRWALIPIALLGMYAIWQWAGALGGGSSGAAAVLLWAYYPDTIAWTSTICPDAPAAAIGVFCIWLFRLWLLKQGWRTALVVGIGMGCSVLAKSSWLILVPLFLILSLAHQHCWNWRAIRQLALIGLTALYVINSGYGFHRSFTRLRDFSFFSETLAGRHEDGSFRSRRPNEAGNRFSGTWLGEILIPLPASFVEGIDLQKYDFEVGKWSYLRGEHQMGGWWYWHLYATCVKTPVGALLLAAVAIAYSFRQIHWLKIFGYSTRDGRLAGPQPHLASRDIGRLNSSASLNSVPVLYEGLILLSPAICLFLLVSSQTGFSRYQRYILPSVPFVFIWVSQVFSMNSRLTPWARRVCWGILAWSVLSSVAVYPHSMAYFNELAGGPENGPDHLLDASIDWGQDVLFLADWNKNHPEANLLYLALHCSFDPALAGIKYQDPPFDPRYHELRELVTKEAPGPEPGWYAVSVHRLHSRNREFAYLLDFPKTDMVGYSIYIYHITEEQVFGWNRKHGFVTEAGTTER